jgi:preprotein translocase subunit YajC
MKLLLVDSSVNYGALVEARKDNVDYIIFNFGTDTYASLADKIIAKNVEFTDIALVQHGGPSHQGRRVQILRSEPIWNSPDPSSVEGFKNLVNVLKERVGLRRFDMLACALYSNQAIRHIISRLEAETGVDFRASTNFTGNAEAGADWMMESDNVDIREVYFTDAISGFKDVLYTYSNYSMYGANKVIKDICGTVIYLHKDIYGRPINPPCDLSGFQLKYPSGKVVTWGGDGGNSSSVSSELQSGVKAIYSTDGAFAALKEGGKVVTWGGNGGNSSSVSSELLSGVEAIYSTERAFAALKEGGKVVTWGGDGGDSSSVSSELLSGVRAIYSTKTAFAALKEGRKVVTWGVEYYGGNSSSVSSELQSGVKAIYSTDGAFAALKEGGKVVTWGYSSFGGDSSSVSGELLSGVKAIYSTRFAFAALKEGGKVVTWGGSLYGGDSSVVSGELLSHVTAIYSTHDAFAALKEGGKVVTWGGSGGNSSSVSSELLSGVTAIYSTIYAFAALKEGGKVVTWGGFYGGNSSSVSSELQSGVKAIYSTGYAFAALKEGGKVVTWGGSGGDSSSVSGELLSGVKAIYSVSYAFAALKEGGKVVTWGFASWGGNSSSVSSELLSGVISIYSTWQAFAALKSTVDISLNDYYYETGASKQIPYTPDTPAPNGAIPCFAPGTKIATPTGERPVETLSSGDFILTADCRKVPVKVYRTKINSTTSINAPYTIPARTFGANQPRAITLSPRHAIQIRKGVWEIPKYAANRYPQIRQAAPGTPITYYHLELPNYFTDNIIANGAVTESFAGKQVTASEPIYVFKNKLGGFIRKQPTLRKSM